MEGLDVLQSIAHPGLKDILLAGVGLSLFVVTVATAIVRMGLPKSYRDRVLTLLERIEASNTKVRVDNTHDAKLVKSAFYKSQLAGLTKCMNSIYDQNGLEDAASTKSRIVTAVRRMVDNTDCDLFALEGMPLFMAPTSEKKKYIVNNTDMDEQLYTLLVRAKSTVKEVMKIDPKVGTYAAKHIVTVGVEEVYISTLQKVTNEFYKDDGRPKK